MLDGYPERASAPEIRNHHIRLLGTGAAAPTVEAGPGITVTRTGAGVYKITWANNPGKFVGFVHCLGAATPSALAGHTVVRDTYDSSAYSLELTLFETTPVAHDLAASEYLDLIVSFAQTGI